MPALASDDCAGPGRAEREEKPMTRVAPGFRLVRLVSLLLLVLAAHPLSASAQGARGEPRLGDAVPFIGPEGDELARVTAGEIVDPFRDYAQGSEPDCGSHYVLLQMSIDNTGSRPLQFDPSTVSLQDDEGFLYRPGYVGRTLESTEAEPDLAYGEVAPGASQQGALVIPVINGTDLTRIIFQPASDRLIILANLGQEAGAEAPVVAATAAPPSAQEVSSPEAANQAFPSPGECRGSVGWYNGTRDRIGGAIDLLLVLDDEAIPVDVDGAMAQLDELIAEQEASNPPDRFVTANQALIDALGHYRTVLQAAVDAAESGDQADVDALFTDLAAANQEYRAAWNQIYETGQGCLPLG
jgi:hypothetical protein